MICEPLQKLYLAVHQWVYARRLRERRRFPGLRVVSIGNLSAGGTGKTPVTALLARRFIDQRPLAVLRGYRGSSGGKGILVSDGEGPSADARRAGDEAAMLARIPGLRVAVCNSRAEAISRWRGDSKLILLDDAFQNPSVYRDHELVLIDATVPPEEIHVIPCGRFREGLDALIRADTVLFTRTDLVARDRLDRWMEAVRGVNRDVELFFSEHRIEGIQPALEQGASVVAFCGIGNPDSFFDLLEREGYSIGQRIAFADHHAFTKREIARLGSVAPPLITTEKDFVRLAASAPEFAKRVHVLKIGFGIVGGREAEFFARIGGDA